MDEYVSHGTGRTDFKVVVTTHKFSILKKEKKGTTYTSDVVYDPFDHRFIILVCVKSMLV